MRDPAETDTEAHSDALDDQKTPVPSDAALPAYVPSPEVVTMAARSDRIADLETELAHTRQLLTGSMKDVESLRAALLNRSQSLGQGTVIH
jgi:hypothetical protein